MAELNGKATNVGTKKKKKRRPKTRIDRLKLKEVTLRKELKETLKEIKTDTKKRGTEDTLTTVERQKLANRSTVIRSKIIRLQDEVGTRSYVNDDKASKHIRAKIENRYQLAARKHNRLLKMTAELEKIKEDEETIRTIANDDLGLETRRENVHGDVDTFLVERRKTFAGISRISGTSLSHSTTEQEAERDEREEHFEHVRESLSKLGVETPREKLEKAQALEQKYDMTREMRNLVHGQMISRPHKNSYWRINPPYRRTKKQVIHVRKSYVRNFYENKIDMVKAKDVEELSPRKETVFLGKPKDEEVNRFKMSSGKTISVNKMKDYTPPGMNLTPVEC